MLRSSCADWYSVAGNVDLSRSPVLTGPPLPSPPNSPSRRMLDGLAPDLTLPLGHGRQAFVLWVDDVADECPDVHINKEQ